MIDKGICDKGFIWSPGTCECEFDKLCDVREYLEYKNCKCRKRLFDKLLEKCSGNNDENEMADNVNNHKKVCNSCIINVALFIIILIISIWISSSAFIYFCWYFKNNFEATIY